ncbi:MAG: FprA family A-type flavoprotein [Candidatus Delongbacteria bacterium]|nr:FprA family A-type flavoprotein [Candidatus Delongbacteria bacterium]
MLPVKLNDDIYWVGGIDWDLRNFHGYLTQRGSTYNAYLIMDEKITLIDTVKHYLADELLERISHVVDPARIDLVISNHVEMDHSGSLPRIMDLLPQAQLVTSPSGEKGLRAHYRKDWNFKIVKSGESVNLGKRSIQFVHTPMVHWPDNMVSYCPEEKILFSNDAFGQHIASSERFDDELPLDMVMGEARKYYANIVLPYGEQVQKALGALAGIPIDMIAPSHGVIWRRHIPAILEEYRQWSTHQTQNRALIIYDTMWGSTEKIAYAIQRAFESRGLSTAMLTLRNNHISDIMTEVLTARYLMIGSPTLNNTMLPTVASFLTYLRGLAPKNRKAAAFGSYGWSGQSIAQVEEILKACNFDIMTDMIRVKYIPDAQELKSIEDKIVSCL